MIPFLKVNRHLLLLALIILLGITLRLWKLDSFLGDALSQDEAMRGYDAYSLLETGKDHRGNAWPLYFEGFSDKRDNYSPLYVYALMPFIKVLGLNEFSVRLPAAIIGTLTILIVYFFTEELFRNRKIALLASFMLAISSWHIFLSRLGMEVIILSFLVSLAFLLLIRWANSKKNIYLLLSSAVWAISFYSYSTARLFVPLMLVGLAYFYRKQIWQNRKIFLFALLAMMILVSPLVAYNIQHWDKIQGRFTEISILANPHEEGYNEFSLFKTHNQYWIFELVKNYIDSSLLVYFIPLFSLAYESIFVLIAIGFLIVKRAEYGENRNFLLYWLLISPLPAAMTNTNPHILRSATIIPLMQILVALGFFYFLKTFGALIGKINKFYLAAIILLLFAGFGDLATNNLRYLGKANFNPPNFLEFNQYGFKRIDAYLKENMEKYNTILFTDKANQPYIFALFYLSWPPENLQNQPMARHYDKHGWQIVDSFDKFKFCDLDSCFENQPKTLVIARENELTNQSLPIQNEWQNPDGTNWKIMTIE